MGDEGVSISDDLKARIAQETEALSPLYLAVDSALEGVIGIHGPLKEGVAQVVADITLTGGNLGAIVALRCTSTGLAQRLDVSFKKVVAINSALLAAGIGIIAPQASLLHNASIVALSLRSRGAYRV